MLYYDGINVNKTRESKECDLCHYWYFLKKYLSFNQISAMDVYEPWQYYYRKHLLSYCDKNNKLKDVLYNIL